MKKTVPLFWGEYGDPNRRLIGYAEVDTDTGEATMLISDEKAKKRLCDPNMKVSMTS